MLSYHPIQQVNGIYYIDILHKSGKAIYYYLTVVIRALHCCFY